MPQPKPKFYLTTPIYYVNARPHIGHAYSTIAADVIARRHRLLGPPVGEDGFPATFFLTGTDEHGQKVQRSAAAAGIPPQQFADEVSATFRALWARIGITHDDFIRTTDPRHKRGVQKLWRDLRANGAIYLSTYTGQYSVGEEMFVEGPPGTLGPDGKPTETVTEENYFFRLSDFQLPLLNLIESGPNGEPPTLHIQPEGVRNEVLSFLRGNVIDAENIKMNLARKPTAEQVECQRAANVPGSSLSFSFEGEPYIPGTLKDLSISRTTFDWGIPVPTPAPTPEAAPAPEALPTPEAVISTEASQSHRDAQWRDPCISPLPLSVPKTPPTAQSHVIYVWLDALANYMTAVGYGSDDPADQAKFARYWPADLHLVGKEITRFHCVYWPAFLLALNPKLRHAPGEPMPTLPPAEHREWAAQWLPKSVVANGWLLFEESKMSKSRGNVVRTETILDAFGPLCPAAPPLPAASPDLSSRSTVEGSASLLPPTKAQQDLFAADVLRYYLLREIPFGQDGSFSFDALITRYNADLANGYGNLVSRTLSMIEKYQSGDVNPIDRSPSGEFLQSISWGIDAVPKQLMGYNFNLALDNCTIMTKEVDGFLTQRKPWKQDLTTSEGKRDVENTLFVAAESIRIITALLYPILPYATASVWRQLGLGDIEEAARNGDLRNLQWGGLKPGTKLGPLAPIFPRADKGLAQIMTDMEAANTPSKPEPTPPGPSPLADDFGDLQPATPNQPAPTESVKSVSSALGLPPEPAPTHPAAGPRTATLPEANPGAKVAGSHALSTERPGTPPHTEAHASGVFAAATDNAPRTTDNAPRTTDTTPQIAIDDFVKIDLRVAQIVLAERIPKADKLLRLEVDLGPLGRRQILSGIAEWYTPEELLGRRIAVIANLAPRKMRGLESHGMLLAASGEDHAAKPILASFSDEIPLGARIR